MQKLTISGSILRNCNFEACRKYEKAADKFAQSIKLNSNYKADAYYDQGRVLYDLKRYDEAITDFDNCIQLQPDYADAYYWSGIILSSSHRDNEAVKKFALFVYKKGVSTYSVYHAVWGKYILPSLGV